MTRLCRRILWRACRAKRRFHRNVLNSSPSNRHSS